jgi:tetratricopeptide (TPR) repeat protein
MQGQLEASQLNNVSNTARLDLPLAPLTETGSVKAWKQPVCMPTYFPDVPDRNPLFLEKRVYQGSSGRVYPLPVIDRIATEAVEHCWQAIHLENEYIRFMVLPEIGGRIHVGLDKVNGYDFFYRQNVIKPALVGLAGPWISGGVEFNWPQHHRPATFLPVEVAIEREPDGSVTVWCSDHDPMTRMKGMHGLRLRPGVACLEVRVRLYNRTLDTQTFLWWANVAVRVHGGYQSFFPGDVRFVADHAKRAITEFPLSQGTYYGIDYGKRAAHGVPAEDQPRCFVPEGCAPNDLSWYANIPVPTSYMIAGSRGDFAGGYDHVRGAGMVYVANHHISPGKKQWTWGNHDFGYAWNRSLTDADGPYVELMAGVYTENQPDFSFLAPGETKAFSQFWYPLRDIGVPDHANVDAALRVEREGGTLRVHLLVTRTIVGASLRISAGRVECGVWQGELRPEAPLRCDFMLPTDGEDYCATLYEGSSTVLRYAPGTIVPMEQPSVETEPPPPRDIAGNDELFLVGLHLEQYRHPTRNPEPYWLEAIARDPHDARANHAMGRLHLRRGEFERAERYLRTAIARLTARNPNPVDGEPYYNLGLALLHQGRTVEAYDAFYKPTWNAAWRGPAYLRLAEIDCSRSEWMPALDHLDRSLIADADNLTARNLKTIVLRRLGRNADGLLAATRELDPLDIFSRYLAEGVAPADGQQRLDLFFDLLRAGLRDEALAIVSAASSGANDGTAALLGYARALVLQQLGREQESAAAYAEAARANASYVFPSRLEEIQMLEAAIRANPRDARAPYYLGNLLYDRRRHREAIALWEQAARLDADFPTTWRNLGFGYYNILRDAEGALGAFAHARANAPHDARILYEQDQLWKRTRAPLQHRLTALEAHRDLVARRDDLTVELASLYNSTSAPEKALALLLSRKFQPWEGGEGLVLGQYMRAHLLLGQRALRAGAHLEALRCFEAAEEFPESLSEVPHLLMNRSIVAYWLGVAEAAMGERLNAERHWERAAKRLGDFQQMAVQSISEQTYWSAQSLRRLGREQDARNLFRRIHEFGAALERQPATIDYFATSLPAMLLFEEDLELRQRIAGRFLRAQALLGLSEASGGRDLLFEIQELDPSHTGVIDMLGHLDLLDSRPVDEA